MSVTHLAAGSTFAGYRIDKEIGRGGMGVVYRATDLSLERPVALKLIAPELSSEERFRQRFLRESKLAASLGHPHILPVHAAGEADGQLYLAMRYVEGQDLKDLLADEGPLSPERAFAIVGQVAEALDAAHEKGLVHRDVKPGNVLLDERGQAYLSDFGLTKQMGSASTQTGELVGTLDYVAPEQIRGENVDGRTDQYALACVLYECLAGKPPFRKRTEAEVLWGHMQEQPPPLSGYSELDPVLARGLAKDRVERYPTCTDLIGSAQEALGIESPRLRRRRQLIRRSRLLLALGALVIAGALAAVAVELTGRESGAIASAPANSLVAIDSSTGKVEAAIETGRTPTAVAAGEGAVWLLNADDNTVTKVDPETTHVEQTFGVEGVVADVAAGQGGIWVVSNGAQTGRAPLTLTRVDPATNAEVVRIVPAPSSESHNTVATSSQRQVAVSASGVWLADPNSGSLWKIDPRTNQVRVSRGGVTPRALAATPKGVWLANPDSNVLAVTSGGRPAQRIGVTATTLDDVAYGSGAIWALDRPDGVLWRIDPGPKPVSRSIPVGVGASSVAYGEGAVWVANGFEGTVLRIDPRTNKVAQTIDVGGVPRGIATGYGKVWTTIGGVEALRALACGPVISDGKGKPDFLITSDLPLNLLARKNTSPAAQAIELVLRARGFRAGRYRLGYQSCDDGLAQAGGPDPYKCAANARSFAGDPSVIAMIGPLNSPCAKIEIPIANRASLPMISPSNSWPGLTRSGPGQERGEPTKYYPTGRRTYFRISSTDAQQAAADAILAKQLGARKVFVLRLLDEVTGSTSDYPLSMSGTFERAARKLGLSVVGTSGWKDSPATYDALVARVSAARPDAVFLGGWLCGSCGELIQKLHARLGPDAALIAPDGFDPTAVRGAAGDAAIGMYVSFDEAPTRALPPAAQRFVRRFRHLHPEADAGDYPPWVPYTAQATEALLAAIARSDGTRPSVVRELHELEIRNGLLGSFRFDRNGDPTVNHTTITRIAKTPPPHGSDIAGATLDRVLSVPPGLVP
jgi:YVTN family beta-propeller protein